MPVKVCTSCLLVKDASEFVYNRLKCKPCYKKEANERYQRSKGIVKEKKNPKINRTNIENETLKKEVERLQNIIKQMEQSITS